MPRAGLDAQIVAEAAAAIVDTDGRAALTLARVAADLGVAAPSLYKHVAGLDDLTFRVATLSVRRMTDNLIAAAMGRSGYEALLAVAEAYRRFAVEHPGLYALTLGGHPFESAERQAEVARGMDVMRALTRSYGVPEDLTVDAIRLIRAALHGFADLETQGGFRLPNGLDKSFLLLVEAIATSLETLGSAKPANQTAGPGQADLLAPAPTTNSIARRRP
ncbi:MAG: WHG domain-containing protein [Alphaproteobacteria bacterium]|nr:WHG domain-containing protein [Alphaproteobacteria bacterium]